MTAEEEREMKTRTRTLTEKQANEAGYRLTYGAYMNTTDDRLDRLYWDRIDSERVDRRGSGYATKREALEDLSERLGEKTR